MHTAHSCSAKLLLHNDSHLGRSPIPSPDYSALPFKQVALRGQRWLLSAGMSPCPLALDTPQMPQGQSAALHWLPPCAPPAPPLLCLSLLGEYGLLGGSELCNRGSGSWGCAAAAEPGTPECILRAVNAACLHFRCLVLPGDVSSSLHVWFYFDGLPSENQFLA